MSHQQTFKKSIFSQGRAKTYEPNDLEINVPQTISYDRLFENVSKKPAKIFTVQEPIQLKFQTPQNFHKNKQKTGNQQVETKQPPIISSENEEEKENYWQNEEKYENLGEIKEKENKNLFKVFENKENHVKPPQKMDISTMESRVFFSQNDQTQEIVELKALNQKYENKIDCLIAENLRMSNKLQELRLQEKSLNLPNIEAKLESLLKENQKLTEIIKNQSLKMVENEEKIKNLEENHVKIKSFEENQRKTEEKLKENDEMIRIQAKKIESFKKEALKTNEEKSHILEELMELKLSKNIEISHENETLINDLKKELMLCKEENARLMEKLQLESMKKSHENFKKNEGKIRRKIDNLQETFDNLAHLNEKLNSHLDAISMKSVRGIPLTERNLNVQQMSPEQTFQNTQKSETTEYF